jgi:hypothetical protein
LLGADEYVWGGGEREREEEILTAIQRTAIRIRRKIPNAQVTLMSGITWGCSLLCFTKEIFPSGFPRDCRKQYFGSVEGTISEVFNQNVDTFQFKIQVKKNTVTGSRYSDCHCYSTAGNIVPLLRNVKVEQI